MLPSAKKKKKNCPDAFQPSIVPQPERAAAAFRRGNPDACSSSSAAASRPGEGEEGCIGCLEVSSFFFFCHPARFIFEIVHICVFFRSFYIGRPTLADKLSANAERCRCRAPLLSCCCCCRGENQRIKHDKKEKEKEGVSSSI